MEPKLTCSMCGSEICGLCGSEENVLQQLPTGVWVCARCAQKYYGPTRPMKPAPDSSDEDCRRYFLLEVFFWAVILLILLWLSGTLLPHWPKRFDSEKPGVEEAR